MQNYLNFTRNHVKMKSNHIFGMILKPNRIFVHRTEINLKYSKSVLVDALFQVILDVYLNL